MRMKGDIVKGPSFYELIFAWLFGTSLTFEFIGENGQNIKKEECYVFLLSRRSVRYCLGPILDYTIFLEMYFNFKEDGKRNSFYEIPWSGFYDFENKTGFQKKGTQCPYFLKG